MSLNTCTPVKHPEAMMPKKATLRKRLKVRRSKLAIGKSLVGCNKLSLQKSPNPKSNFPWKLIKRGAVDVQPTWMPDTTSANLRDHLMGDFEKSGSFNFLWDVQLSVAVCQHRTLLNIGKNSQAVRIKPIKKTRIMRINWHHLIIWITQFDSADSFRPIAPRVVCHSYTLACIFDMRSSQTSSSNRRSRLKLP